MFVVCPTEIIITLLEQKQVHIVLVSDIYGISTWRKNGQKMFYLPSFPIYGLFDFYTSRTLELQI